MTTLTHSRPNDFLYDPTFICSGQKDYCKAAMKACMATSMFAPCPIFPSMFSSLPHRPSQQYIMRYQRRIPDFMDQSYAAKKQQTHKWDCSNVAVNLTKYFASPNITLQAADVRVVDINSSSHMLPALQNAETEVPLPPIRTVECQTQFRESSAQTSPWCPDYKVMQSNDLEILKLDFLKWGSGLPAGMHEINIIERARMKRRWETTLPEVTCPMDMEKRNAFIAALEADEWKFREQEIEDIQMLRLELLEMLLKELHEKTKDRAEKKMKNITEIKQKEKDGKIASLRRKTEREIRKLEVKHKGIKVKYHEVGVLTEHKDFTSELYAPLLRHGQHPKRRDFELHPGVGKQKIRFEGIEKFSTLPSWIVNATDMKNPPTKARMLCPRETKWSAPVLKHLHEELKNLRQQETYRCTLRVRIEPEKPPPRTPEVEGIPQYEEDLHLATILIQSVLRGRASQMIIFEGRDTCRELIQELRSTHGLLAADKQARIAERNNLYQEHGNEMIERNQALQLKEALDRIKGTMIGTLMDFLNKELRRLLTERKAHGICLMAERERQSREAAEAGRRQTEIRRRAEHDQMFKQVVKIHQETVDVYLQDIIMEGIDHISDAEARAYVTSLAQRIDAEAYAFQQKRPGILEQEELVADLVHHFVLPEVEKQLARTRMKIRQQKHLRNAHEMIYSKIDVIPMDENDVGKLTEDSVPHEEIVASNIFNREFGNKERTSFMERTEEANVERSLSCQKGGNVIDPICSEFSLYSDVKDILPRDSSPDTSLISAVNPTFLPIKKQEDNEPRATENGEKIVHVNVKETKQKYGSLKES